MKKVLFIFLVLIFCVPAAAKTIRVLLPWQPQSQFAGVYMAQKKGYYNQLGLNVKITHANSRIMGVDELDKGNYDFIICYCLSGLKAAGSGRDIVNICQIVNTSNCVLVCRKDSGITNVRHLAGKKLSTWIGSDSGIPVKLALAANKLNVKIYEQDVSNSLFLAGGVDVCSCLIYNEYNSLYYSGIDYSDMVVFRLSDLDVDFPEDAIFCTNKTLNRDRRTAKAFVSATLRGWKYAKDNQEETLDEVMKKAKENHLRCSPYHMKFMLRYIIPSIFSDRKEWQLGVLSKKKYNNCVYLLKQYGFIQKIPSYDSFFRKM